MDKEQTESKSILKRIADFIGKDVDAQNESKKLVVVVRIILLSIIANFFINGVVSIVEWNFATIVFYAFFFVVFTGIFIMSYHYKPIMVLWLFNISMIAWICLIVHLFGWNNGVQHYLMVLLVLYFFSSYKQYTGKIVFAIFLCAFRIVLFFIYHTRESVWPLTSMDENMLQIINTVTIFWCISVVAFIFSNDSQELESKLVEYNAQLERQANTDALTGLYNRRKAMEYMEFLVQNARDYTGFSLCICDIDFFKKVNDNYGHDFGDEVLKGIAGIFMEEMKGQNFAARWGGEEFLLLFPGCIGDDAFHILVQIRMRIKRMKFQKGDLEVGVTMTFGLAEYDFNNDLAATIKEADEKLYMGKDQGRDRIVY